MQPNLKILSYQDYENQINHLTSVTKDFLKQQDHLSITKIFTIPRGGLPIGVHLSNYLHINLITTKQEYIKYDPATILVVDDLCDSGETFKRFKDSILCCLFVKPRRIITPDIYLNEIPDDTWVVFPWEPTDAEINKPYMF